MLLRARIALIVSLGLVVLTIGLGGASWLLERRSDRRYTEAYVQGQQVVWQEIVEVEINRLSALAIRLATNPQVIDAAAKGDRSRLSQLMERLFREPDTTELEIAERNGQLLYASSGQLEVSTLDAGLLAELVERQAMVAGIQQDQNRSFIVIVGYPLERRALIGAVTIDEPLSVLLDDLGKALGVQAFLANRRGILMHGTDEELWHALHPRPLVREQPLVVERHGERFYSIATLPVRDTVGRTIAQLVTVADHTAEHAGRRFIRLVALGVIGVFVLALLTGLNLYLRRAFAPLDEAIGVLDALSRGDTSAAVRSGNQKDEIGHIADAVNVFREHAVQVQRAERQKERHRRRQGQLQALRQELDIARNMQQSILPTRFPDDPACQIHAVMHPAREVGGDFYDFFPVRPGEIGLVVADVSGKGIPAALFMAVSRTVLKATAVTGLTPGACLTAVNDLLAEENTQTMFVTLFYGILDTRSGRLVYANGGHNPPYVRRATGAVETVRATDGIALGVVDQMPYDDAELQLASGDALVLFTDGVTEALDAEQNEYTAERLEQSLRRFRGGGVVALMEHVLADVTAFAADAEQADDLTLMTVRYTG